MTPTDKAPKPGSEWAQLWDDDGDIMLSASFDGNMVAVHFFDTGTTKAVLSPKRADCPVIDLGNWREWMPGASATNNELATLRASNAKLREALEEAIDSFEECSQYKGDYLQKKHGDAEDIERLRAALKETE